MKNIYSRKGTIYHHLSSNPALIGKILKDPSKYYRTFYLPKLSGRLRRIDAPKYELKKILKRINKTILCRFRLPKNVKGGVKGESIFTNAFPHLGSSYYLNLDVEQFFPSISSKDIFVFSEKKGVQSLFLNC